MKTIQHYFILLRNIDEIIITKHNNIIFENEKNNLL